MTVSLIPTDIRETHMARGICMVSGKPIERMNQFRRDSADSKAAARLRLLCVATTVMLPAGMEFTGRSWRGPGWCDLVEIDPGKSRPNLFMHRPNDCRASRNDVIFAAAAFSAVFDLDSLSVEKWVWTGDASIPASW